MQIPLTQFPCVLYGQGIPDEDTLWLTVENKTGMSKGR